MFYLQDISIQFLDETNDDPVKALNMLVTYFDYKLSINSKKYDRAAIKFYLINEMIWTVKSFVTLRDLRIF